MDVWTICVVTKTGKDFGNHYVSIKGEKHEAEALMGVIARRGFTNNGERYFRDQIESLCLKEPQHEEPNELS